MKKTGLLIIFLLTIVNSTIAAENKTDTLNPLYKEYKQTALALFNKGKYDSAKLFNKKGYKLAIIENNKNQQGEFLRSIGNCVRQVGKSDSAILLFNKALEIDIKNNNQDKIARNYYLLGKAYNTLPDVTKGFENLNKALLCYKKLKDTLGEIQCYGEIGYVYNSLKKYDESIKAIWQSINLAQKVKGLYMPQIRGYSNIADAYGALNQPQKALDYTYIGLNLCRKAGEQDTSYFYLNLGNIYNSINEPKKAITAFNKVVEMANLISDFKTNKYKTLPVAYQGLGYANALLKKYNEAKLFYTKALEIGKEYNQIESLVLINKELSDTYSKLGDYQKSLEYYKIYHEMSDTIINKTNFETLAKKESKYEYEKKEQQLIAAKAKEELKNKIEIEQQSKAIYLLLIIISILVAGAIIIFLVYRQNKLKSKQRELMIENKLMRAQMSPHFIFNSLNSIQKLVLENKNDAVLSYLNNFSSILRILLENSFHTAVPIDKEISFINHYLSLEKLRFNTNFQFNITTDESINEYTIKIPPMLIQPIIENAIKHGIANKNDGIVSINFWVNAQSTYLHCSIIDNGIGRKKSIELKKETIIEHQSIATELIKERIKQYNYKKRKNLYRMDIIDIYDSNNNSIGTKVEFTFPLN